MFAKICLVDADNVEIRAMGVQSATRIQCGSAE